MKLYCVTHGVVICRDCTIKDHRDCCYEFTRDLAQTYRTDLLATLGKLHGHAQEIKKCVDGNATANLKVVECCDGLKADITAAEEAAVAAVRAHCEGLRTRADSATKRALNAAAARTQAAEAVAKQAEVLLDMGPQLLSVGSDLDFVGVHAGLEEEATRLLALKLQDITVSPSSILRSKQSFTLHSKIFTVSPSNIQQRSQKPCILTFLG
jgi:hypothetical protein